jgi:hypothetical protein
VIAIVLVLVNAKWPSRVAVAVAAAVGFAGALFAIHDQSRTLGSGSAEWGLYASLLGSASLICACAAMLAVERIREFRAAAGNRPGEPSQEASGSLAAELLSAVFSVISLACGVIVAVWIVGWMSRSETNSIADLFTGLTGMTATLIIGPIAAAFALGFASSRRENTDWSQFVFWLALVALMGWLVFYGSSVDEVRSLAGSQPL